MYYFEKPIRLSIMGALALAFSLSVASTVHADDRSLFWDDHPNYCLIPTIPSAPEDPFIPLPNPLPNLPEESTNSSIKGCKISPYTIPRPTHPHVYDFCFCSGHDKWGIALKL